jgi:hypothetical protein
VKERTPYANDGTFELTGHTIIADACNPTELHKFSRGEENTKKEFCAWAKPFPGSENPEEFKCKAYDDKTFLAGQAVKCASGFTKIAFCTKENGKTADECAQPEKSEIDEIKNQECYFEYRVYKYKKAEKEDCDFKGTYKCGGKTYHYGSDVFCPKTGVHGNEPLFCSEDFYKNGNFCDTQADQERNLCYKKFQGENKAVADKAEKEDSKGKTEK